MGSSGPLAISREGFCRYYREQAWTWEHMALTRSRVIAGKSDLRIALNRDIRHILSQPRNPAKLHTDVIDMRARIDQQFGSQQPWRLKYRRGGLVDCQFVAQYLMLRHGHSFDQIFDADTERALTNLAAIDAVSGADAEILVNAHRLARHLSFFIRLVTAIDQPFDPASAPYAVLSRIADIAGMPTKITSVLDFLPIGNHVSEVLDHAFAIYQQQTGSSS